MNRFDKYLLFIILLMGRNFCLIAQFAPAAGLSGSTAIYKDDTQFVEWATACTIQRGYLDIAIPDSGYASLGTGPAAVGNAGTSGVVSLGDGGMAVLSFQHPVYNGPGFDFAVFENGFSTGDTALAFLEFAFVEVSSDGINFFRFPATSNTQDTMQIGLQSIDCSLVNNLAGKYVSGYGTPFDLEDLENQSGLDVNNITAIRLIDVVGSINNVFATHDQFGKKINDPYPTPFPSSGFDLDAVGIIHAVGISSVNDTNRNKDEFHIFPNPASPGITRYLRLTESMPGSILKIYGVTGGLVMEKYVNTTNFVIPTGHIEPGVYFLSLESDAQRITAKMVIE